MAPASQHASKSDVKRQPWLVGCGVEDQCDEGRRPTRERLGGHSRKALVARMHDLDATTVVVDINVEIAFG